MPVISASLSGSGYSPSSTLPSDPLEVVFDGSNYICPSGDDLFSADPLGSKVVNIFSGSKQLDLSFFGIHATGFPQNNGSLSDVSASIVRTHDWAFGGGNMRWRDIEKSQGVFTWDAADAFVNAVVASGKSVLWVLGPCTPAWASSRPTETNIYGMLGMAAEPASMSYWGNFCSVLATRYAGKISHYQIWNEVDLANTYTGSQASLSQMTRIAAQAIKAVDPAAKIVGPSVSMISTATDGGTGCQYLVSYLGASDGATGTALDWLDIVAVHMYAPSWIVSNWYQIPTQWARVETNIRPLIGARPIWDSEMGMISVNLLNNGASGDAFLKRRMIINAALGLQHSSFYDMFGTTDGPKRDTDGSLLTAWNDMVHILTSKPLQLVNIIANERIAAVIGGVRYLI